MNPDATAAPRAITWATLLLALLSMVLLMSLLAAGAGYWAWQNLTARVTLPPQTADITLPRELAVSATLSNRLSVQVNQVIDARVPIDEVLTIPMPDPLQVHASIDTSVPLALDIPVEHVLKVDQVVDLDTTVKTRVLGIPVTLPLQGKVPLKADVPISVMVPVRQRVPISFTAPVTIRFTEPLRARISTTVTTQIPIRETFELPVTAPVDASLSFPQQNVRAGLASMDLQVPLAAITVGRTAAPKP